MSVTLPIFVGATTLLAGAAAAAFIHHAAYSVRSQWWGPTVWRGRPDTAAVALTFDDGPGADTERVLDVLQAYGARATFFMVGRQVRQYPQTARRIVNEGHEVGNHSYSHPIFLYRTNAETRRQLQRTQQIIHETTGVRPVWARPPCGVRTPAYFAAARDLGLRTVQWDVAGFDWQRHSAERIARDVLREAQAGSIILLHDADSAQRQDRAATVAALPWLLEGLRARRLRVAPLSELIGITP